MTTKPIVTVSRLPHVEQHGDWHDRPTRYIVEGPNGEVQKFSTKREAENYAIDRRRSDSQFAAIEAWMLRK